MPQVITAGQMADITNAIHALIAAIVLGLTGVVATYLYQWKVALPRQFKLRDEQRTAEIEAAKLELKNKADAESVDIERERMLPRLIESTITMSQNFNATMMQNVQQTAAYVAQLTAHDRMLSANTDRLEELAQTVETAIANIQLLKTAVEANTGHSKAAAAFGEQAATKAQETLEIVKKKIIQVVADTKSDTGEIKTITAPTSDAGSAAA